MNQNVLALAGGVGGAKLVLGLSRLPIPPKLTVVVNTGDDEEFHGLHVSPDLDTVMYTLAGISNQSTGWGLQGETFNLLTQLSGYDQETWFKLGDKDLATHIYRTNLLKQGKTLSEVTQALCNSLGINQIVLPMTDGHMRTILDTEIGPLKFQDYFVKYKCEPKVNAINFNRSRDTCPTPLFVDSLRNSGTLIYCPSNPYLSIDPILALPNIRDMIKSFEGVRIAISPIVGNQALRGPAAKLMLELGIESSCVSVARKYIDMCDVFVIDQIDSERAGEIRDMGFRVEILDTVMVSDKDKIDLGHRILEIARQI